MKPNDVISYTDLQREEKARLQKGMNYRVGKTYSVFLMSVRKAAPYADALDPKTGMLTYEGHDEPKSAGCPVPKNLDQPMLTPKGSWTENGKFFRDAVNYKSGALKQPELIKVYEKLSKGIWCYKGFFELVDARIVNDGSRNVFKFFLNPVERRAVTGRVAIPVKRVIPTYVKVQVWQRDHGRCVQCGSDKHLHFDHDIPFSKGGSSITVENVRLLCAKHNLEKSDRIMVLLPYILASSTAAAHLLRN